MCFPSPLLILTYSRAPSTCITYHPPHCSLPRNRPSCPTPQKKLCQYYGCCSSCSSVSVCQVENLSMDAQRFAILDRMLTTAFSAPWVCLNCRKMLNASPTFSLVLVAIDHCSTFPEEVEYVWCRGRSFGSVLFCLNRYIGLLNIVLSIFEVSSSPLISEDVSAAASSRLVIADRSNYYPEVLWLTRYILPS